jgi:2-oxoisovalerate dehydrogenase E1 component
LVQDNRYSISTKTEGKTFYSAPNRDLKSFYGLKIHRLDGSDPIACRETLGRLVNRIRATREPSLCVMRVARLFGHTNADDESVYRSAEEIEDARANADPLAKLRETLLDWGVGEREMESLDAAIGSEVRVAADRALERDSPQAAFEAKAPIPNTLTHRDLEYYGAAGDAHLTMAGALRGTLLENMRADSRVTLYGEDIEDPKGMCSASRVG